MSLDEEILFHLYRQTSFGFNTGFNSVSGTSETPFFLLKNEASDIITITSIKAGDSSESYGTTFRIYGVPTITTDGTALTAFNNVVGSSQTTLVEGYKFPTISDNGTLLETVYLPAAHPIKGINRIYKIMPSSSLLITVENEVSNLESTVEIYFLDN